MYAVAYPMSAFGKPPHWRRWSMGGGASRPVSCCMAVVTMCLGGDVAPCWTAYPLLDHRPRDLRPLVERYLIMIKERVFIGHFRRPSLSHVTCSSDKEPRPSARPPEGVISSGRASQHPFNWGPPPEWLPAQAHRQTAHFLSPTGVPPRRPYRLSRRKLRRRFARFDSLSRGITVSAGASDEVGRVRPHLS
jgi:hypothetical protein